MSKDGSILIVTDHLDAHTDRMILKMREQGIQPIRLNYNDIPNNVNMNRSYGDPNLNQIAFKTNNRVIQLDQLKSIWWRKPQFFHEMPNMSEQEQRFLREEMTHFLKGMWASTNCYWLSHPDAIAMGSRKSEQLQRAQAHGFKIPKTLISNDLEAIQQFYVDCEKQMIYKVLTDPYLNADFSQIAIVGHLNPPKVTKTTPITQKMLDAMRESVLGIGQFQAYVPKHSEIRATVIGTSIFAAEIHSQEEETTRIDWRNYEIDIPYTAHELPKALAEQCIHFVRSYGLEFGAMDFILTPSNEYVFLENNPVGQFMFIEDKVPSLLMTQAVIDVLVRGQSGTS